VEAQPSQLATAGSGQSELMKSFFSFPFEQQFSLHSERPTNSKVDQIFWVKTQKLKLMVNQKIHDQQERK